MSVAIKTNVTLCGFTNWVETFRSIYNRLNSRGSNVKAILDLLQGVITSYWNSLGYSSLEDIQEAPVGAATLSIHTVYHALHQGNFKVLFHKYCLRYGDFRSHKYGLNTFSRSSVHRQLQVIARDPHLTRKGLMDSILDMFTLLGLKRTEVSFTPDRWESTLIQAYGRGYEVRYRGVEILQFTEFTLFGGKRIEPMFELAIGLERLAYVLLIEAGVNLTSTFYYSVYDRAVQKQFKASPSREYLIQVLRLYHILKVRTSDWDGCLTLIDCFNKWSLLNQNGFQRIYLLDRIRALMIRLMPSYTNSDAYLQVASIRTPIRLPYYRGTLYSPYDRMLITHVMKRSLVYDVNCFEAFWSNGRLMEELGEIKLILKGRISAVDYYLGLGSLKVDLIYNMLILNLAQDEALLSMFDLGDWCLRQSRTYGIRISSSSDEGGIRRYSKDLIQLWKREVVDVAFPSCTFVQEILLPIAGLKYFPGLRTIDVDYIKSNTDKLRALYKRVLRLVYARSKAELLRDQDRFQPIHLSLRDHVRLTTSFIDTVRINTCSNLLNLVYLMCTLRRKAGCFRRR